MNQQNESYIHLHIPKENKEQRLAYSGRLTGLWILITYITFVIASSFIDLFSINHVFWITHLIGSLIIGVHFLMQPKWNSSVRVYSFFVVLIIVLIVFQQYVINGLFITVNYVIKTIGRHTATYILPYEITLTSYETFSVNLFWGIVSVFISLSIYIILRHHLSYLIFIYVCLIYLFQIVTSITPSIYSNIALFSLILLSLHDWFVHRMGRRQTLFESSRIMTVTFLSLTLLLVFGVGSLLSLFGLATLIEKPSFVTNIEKQVNSIYETMKYGKQDMHFLPDGKLYQLHEFKVTDEPVMDIAMEKPQSYYLRGFIGGAYTGSEWVTLSEKVQYDNYNLFYWLSQEGFDPLQQLTMAKEIGSPDDEHPRYDLIVHNKQGSSKYVYTPYEFANSINPEDELHYFQEFSLKSKKVKGTRQYRYKVSENLVKYYPRLANRLYRSYEDDSVEFYLELEGHYRNFVYEHYTQLTDKLTTVYDLYLKAHVKEQERISYESAIELVEEYIDYFLNYEENPANVPEREDFVTYVIQETNSGYSPHYATVATTMFRYLGIPARYVEGYLITPEMIQDLDSNEIVEITGEEAHAWTEIYIDELGWIPLEFTPPYKEVMEQTDMSEYPKGKWSVEGKEEDASIDEEQQDSDANVSSIEDDVSDEMKEKDNHQEESEGNEEGESGGDSSDGENDTNVTEEPEQEQPYIWKLILLITLVILLLLLLFYFAYFVKKRYELAKLKKSFHSEDLNYAARRLFSYTLLLMHYDGVKKRHGSTYKYVNDIKKKYGKDYSDEFKAMINITQEALYSNRLISVADRERMLIYNKKLLNKVKETKSLFQKCKMRMWDFIY